jgi:hypothetical protein
MSSKLSELGLPESITYNAEAFVKTIFSIDPVDPVRIGVL